MESPFDSPLKATFIERDPPHHSYWIVTNDAGDPAEEYDVSETLTAEQAAYIVRAVNSHAALLAELKRLQAWFDREAGLVQETGTGSTEGELIDEAVRIKAVVAKAERK